MASSKDTFEANTFKANTFAAGMFRGTGVTILIIDVEDGSAVPLPQRRISTSLSTRAISVSLPKRSIASQLRTND